MVKSTHRAFGVLFVLLALPLALAAERQTGSLKGRVTDKAGFPLPGAFIYVASPAQLGMQNYITGDSGDYGFLSLPAGTYKVTVEMPGFKTVNVDGVRVAAGRTLALNVRLEATEIEEEITNLDAAPALDGRSAASSFVIDADLVRRAPLPRDFAALLDLVPGLVPERSPSDGRFAAYGSTVRANTYSLGGADVTDPLDMAPMAALNTDIVAEVDVAAAGLPVDGYPAGGAFVNIVTRSGGNRFLGEIKLHHASPGLSKGLWTESEYAANGLAAPAASPRLWDFSLALGGAVLEDRGWYFTAFRLAFKSAPAPFAAWTDPLAKSHPAYDWKNRDLFSFLKIGAQVTSQIRAGAYLDIQDRFQAVDESYLTWSFPEAATRSLKHDGLVVAGASVDYKMDQNTLIDIRLALSQRRKPLLLGPEATGLPSYADAATGRVWGNAPYNESSTDRRFKASASITRLQEGLGIAHELKAGAEYEDAYADVSTWKEDNLAMTWYGGSPYYFGTAVSPKSGNTVGKGLVAFSLAGKAENDFVLKNEMKRLGFYAQDALTIANRATLHLGLRFDRSAARIPVIARGASGNAISVTLGDTLIKPVTGVNPYAAITVTDWDQVMVWNALSPRVGLSFDLLGDGRTILRSSFARYAGYMPVGLVRGLSPFLPTRSHGFLWYDEDGTGIVDAKDTFSLYLDDLRTYKEAYARKRVAEDLKAPTIDEIALEFGHQVTRDLTVSARYVSRTHKNIVESVLFDPDTDTAWYRADGETADWWVPFTTIVPASGDYGETPVTVYYRSTAAPALFDQLQNVPELTRKYGAFELTVRKRMSANWQLFGSVVWSRARGNAGLGTPASSGFSALAGSPNSLVNVGEDSRLDLDRPAAVRLLATYRFPWDFYLTLMYSRMSGAPWARTATILPPDAWAEANGAIAEPVTVYLESPGARRLDTAQSLDGRLEKEFVFRSQKRLTLTVDVFNILGTKSSLLDLDDGGFWYPAAAGASEGTRVLNPTFQKYTSLWGARQFRLTLAVQF